MKTNSELKKTIATLTLLIAPITQPWPNAYAQTPPAIVDIANAPIPMRILVQSRRTPRRIFR
jgi:hypothetical protein